MPFLEMQAFQLARIHNKFLFAVMKNLRLIHGFAPFNLKIQY